MDSDVSIVLLSLRVAAVSMLGVIPAALGAGWLLARRDFPGKFVVEALTMLPLALPPVLVGFVLLWALGAGSPLGRAAEAVFGTGIAFTWLAASIAAATVAFPLAVRAYAAAIGGVDRRLEVAARGLGAGPWRVFFRITIPLAHRGLLAGTLLAFVRALSEFGATIIVAGNIPGRTQTLPSAIFTRIATGDDAAVWGLAAISIAIALLTLAAHNRLLRQPEGKASPR